MQLSPRQEQAAAVADQLQALGAHVITCLPLAPEQELRFQISDLLRDQLISKVCEWGWIPTPVGPLPRFTPNGLEAASVYEIRIEHERQPIVDDRRTIYGERATREKTPHEHEMLRRYLGMLPK
jgi:hypothetical protein